VREKLRRPPGKTREKGVANFEEVAQKRKLQRGKLFDMEGQGNKKGKTELDFPREKRKRKTRGRRGKKSKVLTRKKKGKGDGTSTGIEKIGPAR